MLLTIFAVALAATTLTLAQQPRRASADPDALPAGPKALPIPAGRQVFYDTTTMPWPAEGGRRKTVLGDNVTFNLAELTPSPGRGRGRAPGAPIGHHHDYEQVLFGLEGIYLQAAGPTVTCRVGRLMACLEPPNVPHSVTGYESQDKVLTIEFIPLARKDLVPPRPQIDYPMSPEPMPIPAGMEVYADFNKMAWVGPAGQAQFKALIGKTCSLVLWHLPAATFKGTSAPGHHHTAEQISYVIEGHADVRVGDQVRRVGPGMMILIPPDVEHLPMTAVNNEDVLLLDFQPAVRRDLLKQMGKS
jgi:quercetin dioxygenase-like cupin family protein